MYKNTKDFSLNSNKNVFIGPDSLKTQHGSVMIPHVKTFLLQRGSAGDIKFIICA